MSLAAERYKRMELEKILRELMCEGYLVIPLRQLFWLLEKGNKAAGTWYTLLDYWEEVNSVRDGLYIAELPGERLLLTNVEGERGLIKSGEE